MPFIRSSDLRTAASWSVRGYRAKSTPSSEAHLVSTTLSTNATPESDVQRKELRQIHTHWFSQPTLFSSPIALQELRLRVVWAKKIRQVRKRIVQRAVEHALQRFLTLTLDPKKMKHGLSTKEKIVYLYAAWRKMRVYLQRKLGKSLVFIAVLELQGNGNPHLHLLVGSYIPKRWISTSWQALGGGWATRIEYADMHRVAAYLSKYLTEDSLLNLPPRTRRFSTSRGLALFERKKSNGTWIVVRSSIEYWRHVAAEVITERFETEQDGNSTLASFVAVQVPSVLASRLQDINAPRLEIEIRRRKRKFGNSNMSNL